MGNTFEDDAYYKSLEPPLSGYSTTAPLRIERICVRLQGFNYLLNYVPGKKGGSENNEADYHSWHPEPLAMQKSQVCMSQAEFELRETVEEFEKDIMTIVKSSVPEAATWQKLLEETHSDTELEDASRRKGREHSGRKMMPFSQSCHSRRAGGPRFTNRSSQNSAA